MLRLLTFGGLNIEADAGSASPRVRPPRLALLAVLAAAGDRGVSRERLTALLWPEADEAHARHSLRQTRYALRNELGQEVIRAESPVLSLDPAAITSDVAEFNAALANGDRRAAAALARRPFLDGFYLPGASVFERWVEDERARLASASLSAIAGLASDASIAGDYDAATTWRRELTVRDPLSDRFALGYLKALAASGARADALAFARQHEALVRRELESDPDPEVKRLEAELRAMPTPVVSRAVSAANGHAPVVERTLTHVIVAPPRRRVPNRLGLLVAGTAAALLLTGTAAVARQRGWMSNDVGPVLAVGLIRADAPGDTLHLGRVLTDMVATSLARIEGLAVTANSRLLELIQPGRDSAATYADAARRAGASQLLEGTVTALPNGTLALEMRRVDLRSGVVREVYRARAENRYALVDSVTQTVARRFHLPSPPGSIATATTTSPVAYRIYEEGLRLMFESDARTVERFMYAARVEDSTFAMAAYYEVLMASGMGDERLADGRLTTEAQQATLRLARRAPDRERLLITASLLNFLQDPSALPTADSLATQFPNDPRAFEALGRARWTGGDWSGSVAAIERAIALDSAAETGNARGCHVCGDLAALEETYLWWDSLPAAARTERRLLTFQPGAKHAWYMLTFIAARQGDSVAAYDAYRRTVALDNGDKAHAKLRLDLTLGAYENVERDVRPLLASPAPGEWADGENSLLLALRNEGRLRDAIELHRTGWLPGFPAVPQSPNDFDSGILALESGDGRAAATVFREKARRVDPRLPPGAQARVRAWNRTLEGAALAAAGDTAGVRALIDTVEYWGARTAYGRDRREHHYLRGLMFVAQRRDDDAVREFRSAIHSPNFGFTRVNYDLASALLRLNRPAEAVATLQSSLRGEIEASNLYVTRTDLHERLAQAFEAAGQADSARVHYQKVVDAWRHADPVYQTRRARAVEWIKRDAAAGGGKREAGSGTRG